MKIGACLKPSYMQYAVQKDRIRLYGASLLNGCKERFFIFDFLMEYCNAHEKGNFLEQININSGVA